MRRIGLVVLLTLLAGCAAGEPAPVELTLATTTSTYDSGLLDALLPSFERETGIAVKVLSVGSGQAFEIARRGDADVVLVHAPRMEQQFMEEGFGAARWPIMRDDFILVGPADDPAQVAQAGTAAAAFQQIAARAARFISRGDQSGTHLRENELWETAGLAPRGAWYIAAGTGMAQALRIAHERQAYTLTDQATFVTLQKELNLRPLLADDPQLVNIYSVIVVNPAKHPHLHAAEAQRLAEFLLTPTTLQAIAQFGSERYGQPLFTLLEAEDAPRGK